MNEELEELEGLYSDIDRMNQFIEAFNNRLIGELTVKEFYLIELYKKKIRSTNDKIKKMVKEAGKE